MKKSLLVISILFVSIASVIAQTRFDNNDQHYRITIKKAKGKIIIDGKIEEPDWQASEMVTNFWQSIPYDSAHANVKTEVRVTFDDNFLYVSGICYQPQKYVVTSLKRDFQNGTTDIFGINLDTFKDKLNGFNFAISPYGVQREGLVSNGSEVDNSWDNKWYSEVRNFNDKWVVEMAIPFKTLRYKSNEGVNEWLVNFLRFDQTQARTERSMWAPVPRNFPGNALAFSGTMVWETPPPKPGANISVIPYLLGDSDKDYFNKKAANVHGNVGVDAKIAITPSLNLDVTVNPDFAQVEVDRQVTNLSRFELFFPERRQFFVENADLFGSFGLSNINPFFSRRIGLKNGTKVPILAGLRLSGRVNKNWRVGLLSMQTAAKSDSSASLYEPQANFSMVAVQRRVFKRSNIAFVLMNRQNFLNTEAERNANPNAFTRIIGLDYNLASNDGRWQGKFFYHKALVSKNDVGQYATAASINYFSRTWAFEQSYEMVGENYGVANATGYVARNNYYRTEPNVSYTFYPRSSFINSWSIGADGDWFWRISDNKSLDWDFSPVFFRVAFQNAAQLRITPLRWNYTYLFSDFDPTNTGGQTLKTDTKYIYKNLRINYVSNSRTSVFYSVQGLFGEYFNGEIAQIHTTINYRYQPYGVFSVDLTYNKIKLPAPYSSAELVLISPRIDLSFSKSVFFTTFVQYNNQRNNMNVNARFQWRFKPVSDLFVVYTENAFASPTDIDSYHYRALQTKNRALVLKLTYWLNI